MFKITMKDVPEAWQGQIVKWFQVRENIVIFIITKYVNTKDKEIRCVYCDTPTNQFYVLIFQTRVLVDN